MRKKITLILLVFFLTMSALSVVPLPTSAANLIINGTFEGIDSDTGYLRGWRVEESAWGTALSVCSTEKFSGQYALKMISQNNEEVSIYEYSATQDLIPGSRYKLAFWYKDDYALGTAAQIALTTQFINANNRGIAGSNETETISASKSGKWLSYIKYVTIPSDAKRLYVKIGVTGGTIYIDDLLCDQQSDIGDLEAGENLVNNGGFEDSAKNTPDQWNYRTLASGHSFSERTNEKAHTGDYSLKIQCDNTVTEEAKTKPFAWENVYNVEPLATYKLSTYLNISAADGTANALFKCEYYKRTVDSDELECVGSNHSDGLGQTLGQWLRVEKTITIPAGASVFRIYCRLFGNGIAYFDDISLIKVTAPKAAVATTDKIFFYSDMTEYGNISVTLNTETYPELTGGKIDFTITDPDGNIKVSEEQDIDSNNTAVFSYSSDTLSELKSAYTIHATPKTAQGVQIGEPATQKIYKYARPQYLDRDGVYRVNNEIFNPTVVYHCPVSAYSTCKDLGINVVQATESNVEAAKEAGLKVLLVLYSNMIAAGAPENIENTKRVVAKYKDDPAIFAYAIMDEPRAYYPENDRSALENSYVAIRNIDDKHPVWITDSPGGLGTTSEYCDIFCHEVYENEKLFDTSTKEKLGGNRALYSLVRIPEDKNIDTIRSRVFSSIAFGATGFGYFIENYSSLLSEELYESLKNMTEYEISHVEEAFVNGSTNTIFSDIKNDMICRIFEKDGHTYILLMNPTAKETEVKLTGSVKDIFQSKVCHVFGINDKLTNYNEASYFKIPLEPYQCLFIKLYDSVKISEIKENSYGVFTLGCSPFLISRDGEAICLLQKGTAASLSDAGNMIGIYNVYNGVYELENILFSESGVKTALPNDSFEIELFTWEALNNMVPLRNVSVYKFAE